MKTKFSFIFFILLINSSLLFSQVAINTDGSVPNSSGMLDVKSNNKGFLPPRMTQAEMMAIPNPANGLIVYCTDCEQSGTSGALSIFMAGTWFELAIKNVTVIDIDGNTYHTVTIGAQTWMVENLMTTRCRNGEAIPNATNGTAWWALATGAYCWYNNDPANKTVYGGSYNWYAVADSNIAPAGWHVPTDAEWTTLTDYLGGIGVAGDIQKKQAHLTG